MIEEETSGYLIKVNLSDANIGIVIDLVTYKLRGDSLVELFKQLSLQVRFDILKIIINCSLEAFIFRDIAREFIELIPLNELENIFQFYTSLKQELTFIEQFYPSAYNDLSCSLKMKKLFDMGEVGSDTDLLIEEIDRVRFKVFSSIIKIRSDLEVYLRTGSSKSSLQAVLQYEQVVLITGEEMSGKSFLINETFATDDYFTYYVDSGSESSSLIGNYIIGSESEREFEWRNGPLVKSMLQGSVLVMESFEMANPQLVSFVQGLVSNLSVRVKEDIVSPSPGFKLIILSRNPESIKDVHVMRLNPNVLKDFINKKCSESNLETNVGCFVTKLIKVVNDNYLKCSKSQISKLLNRLIDIVKNISFKGSSLFLSSEIKTFILLSIRDVFFNGDTSQIQEWDSLGAVASVFEMELQEAVILLNHYEPIYQISDKEIRTSRSIIARGIVNDAQTDRSFCSTASVVSLIDKVGVAVKLNESLLLVGETGCGKTSVIQHLANISGNNLKVINLSKVTDVSDIFGGIKPVSLKQKCLSILNKIRLFLESFFDVNKNKDFITYLLKNIENANYVAFAKTAMSGSNKLLATEVSRILTETERLSYKSSCLELQKADQELRNIAQSKNTPMFEFVKGVLSECYENGYWLLVDEINLAPESVLLRLSTIITSPSLQLDEGGFSVNLKRHKNFRLFACMNPAFEIGKKALPTRTANLMTCLEVSAMETVDEIANLISHLFRRHSSVNKLMCFKFAEFFYKTRSLSQSNEIRDTSDRKLPISIRQLRRGIELSISLIESEQITIGVVNALYAGCRVAFRLEMSLASQNIFDSCFNEIMGTKEIEKRYVKEDFFMLTPKAFRIILSHPIPKFGSYVEVPSHIITPTLREILPDILKVLSFNDELPILLEGPTSCGKTSLLTFLAAHYGKRLVRINNHRDTDVEEYIGGWVPDGNGGARFKEGVLLSAMRNGQWLLLDELNLAKSEILEALNRILDDNREIYVPEINEVVRPTEGFRIFATQNPSSYSGRSLLSSAFRNRFISVSLDHLTNDDLIRIMQERGQLPESRLKSILNTMSRLHSLRTVDSALSGKESLITVRDLLRWSSRPFSAESKEGLAMEGFWLLGERIRETSNKRIIGNIISKECLGKEITLETSYKVIYENLLKSHPMVSDIISQMNLKVNNSFKRALSLGFRALTNHQSILLIGEAGTGKTSIASLISKILNVVYYSINCHKQTEAADFLGTWRPKRDSLGFEWVEGELLKAVRSGGLYLIDEISLASDSVLERLNSLLEFERKISFQGGNDELIELKANDNFYLVATMNPGGDQGKRELSPALRNRFCEIWVTSPFDNDSDIVDLIDLIVPPNVKSSSIYVDLAEFLKILIKAINYEYSHLFKAWTIRDLKSWSEMTNRLIENNMSIAKAIFVSLEHLFESTIGIIESQETKVLAGDILSKMKKSFYSRNNLIDLLEKEIRLALTETHLSIEEIQLKIYREHQTIKSSFNHDFYITEDTGVKENIFRIVLGMLSGRSVMLEGPPGIGKTSLVEWMACCLNKQVYRISLSEQTDMIDLLGNDTPDPNYPSKFIWRDGSLLRALKSGDWILLDELNLASQTVLEGLNSLLDHRGLMYLPELNQTIVQSSEFRLFATQNPSSMGSGRKGLPLSFMNRFTRVYLNDIEVNSLKNVTNQLSDDNDRKFIDEFIDLCKEHNVPKTNFNLRLIKRIIVFFEKYKCFSHQMKIVAALYLFVKDIPNFSTVSNVIEKQNLLSKPSMIVYVESLQTLALYNEESVDDYAIHPIDLKATCSEMSVLSRETGFLAWRIMMGADMCLPVVITHSVESLLVVTSLLDQIAVSNSKKLVKVRLFNSADLSELLGSFEQIDWKSSLTKLIKRMKLQVDISLDQEVILQNLKNSTDPHLARELSEIEVVKNKGGSSFVWRDSELITSAISGDWIVLSNCQEVNPAIIEKLNGFLEDRRLIVEESFETNGSPREVHAHPSFRIFMLYQDSKGKKPSSALVNRCLTISVDKDYAENFSSLENIRKLGTRIEIIKSITSDLGSGVTAIEFNDLEFSSMLRNTLSKPFSSVDFQKSTPMTCSGNPLHLQEAIQESVFDLKINNVISNLLVKNANHSFNLVNDKECQEINLLNDCLKRLNSLNPKIVKHLLDQNPISESGLLMLGILNDSDIQNCQDKYSLFKDLLSTSHNLMDLEEEETNRTVREPAVIVSVIFLQRILFPDIDIKNRLFYNSKEGVCLQSLLFDQTFWTKVKLSEIYFPESVSGLRQLLIEVCLSLKNQFIDLSVNLLEDAKENPAFEKLLRIGTQLSQIVDSNYTSILTKIKISKIKLIDEVEDEDLFLEIPSRQINLAIECLVGLSPKLVPSELDLFTSEWSSHYQSVSNFLQKLNGLLSFLDSFASIPSSFDQILQIKTIVALKYRKLGQEIMRQLNLRVTSIREILLYEDVQLKIRRISMFLAKIEQLSRNSPISEKLHGLANIRNSSDSISSVSKISTTCNKSMSMDEFIAEIKSISELELILLKNEKKEIEKLMPRLSKTVEMKQQRDQLNLKINKLSSRVSRLNRKRIVIADIDSDVNQDFLFSQIFQNGKLIVQSSSIDSYDFENEFANKIKAIREIISSEYSDVDLEETIECALNLYFKIGGSINSSVVNDQEVELLSDILICNSKFSEIQNPDLQSNNLSLLLEIDSNHGLKNLKTEICEKIKIEISELNAMYLKEIDELTVGNSLNTEAANEHRLLKALKKATIDEYTKQAVEQHKEDELKSYQEFFEPIEENYTVTQKRQKCIYVFNQLIFWAMSNLKTKCSLKFDGLSSQLDCVKDVSLLPLSSILNYFLDQSNQNDKSSFSSQLLDFKQSKITPLSDLLGILIQLETESSAKKCFYGDPIEYSHLKKVVETVNSITVVLGKILEVETEVRNLPSFIKVARAINLFLSSPRNSSSSLVATLLERIIESLGELNNFLPSTLKVINELNDTTNHLRDLRRAERGLFQSFASKQRLLYSAQSIYPLSNLLNEHKQKRDSEKFLSDVETIIRSTSIGAFAVVSTILLCYSQNYSKLASTLISLYSSFTEELTLMTKEATGKGNEILRSASKLMNWHFDDIMNLKLNVQKYRKAILRAVRHQQEGLETPFYSSVVQVTRNAQIFGEFEPLCNFVNGKLIRADKKKCKSIHLKKENIVNSFEEETIIKSCLIVDGLSFWTMVSLKKLHVVSSSGKNANIKFRISRKSLPKDTLWRLCKEYLNRMNALKLNPGRTFKLRALTDFMKDLAAWGVKGRAVGTKDLTFDKLLSSVTTIDTEFSDISEFINFDSLAIGDKIKQINNRIFRIADNFRVLGETKDLSVEIDTMMREKLTGVNLSAYHVLVQHNKIVKSILKLSNEITQFIFKIRKSEEDVLSKIKSIVFKFKNKWSPSLSKSNDAFNKIEELLRTKDLIKLQDYIDSIKEEVINESMSLAEMVRLIKSTTNEHQLSTQKSIAENLLKDEFGKFYQNSKKRMRFDLYNLANESNPIREQEKMLLSIQRYFRDLRQNIKTHNYEKNIEEIKLDLSVKIVHCIDWLYTLGKFAYLVSVIFINLQVKGFCTPLEEQTESLTTDDFETEIGTGVGEGRGEDDITKELEFDEQVAGVKGEEECEEAEDDLKADENEMEIDREFNGDNNKKKETNPDEENKEEENEKEEKEAQDEFDNVDKDDLDLKLFQDENDSKEEEEDQEEEKRRDADNLELNAEHLNKKNEIQKAKEDNDNDIRNLNKEGVENSQDQNESIDEQSDQENQSDQGDVKDEKWDSSYKSEGNEKENWDEEDQEQEIELEIKSECEAQLDERNPGSLNEEGDEDDDIQSLPEDTDNEKANDKMNPKKEDKTQIKSQQENLLNNQNKELNKDENENKESNQENQIRREKRKEQENAEKTEKKQQIIKNIFDSDKVLDTEMINKLMEDIELIDNEDEIEEEENDVDENEWTVNKDKSKGFSARGLSNKNQKQLKEESETKEDKETEEEESKIPKNKNSNNVLNKRKCDKDEEEDSKIKNEESDQKKPEWSVIESNKKIKTEEAKTTVNSISKELYDFYVNEVETVIQNNEGQFTVDTARLIIQSESDRLCEFLKSILEQRKAIDLRGDFRTGKRLNIRRLVGYIASNYRKDKIWLRRIEPSDRDFRILLAVDDSASMMEKNVGKEALYSLSILAGALTKASVGDLSIASIRNGMKIVEGPTKTWSETTTEKMFKEFNFQYQAECSADLSMPCFIEQSQSYLLKSNDEKKSICIILSDGRLNKELVCEKLVEAESKGIIYIYFLLDITDELNSVLNYRTTKIENGPEGVKVIIREYLEDFPFRYYIIIKDMKKLAENIASVLRQCFEQEE